MSFQITSNGQVDAVAMWYDLHLTKDISFSTSPDCDISFSQALFPMKYPLLTSEKDTLQISIGCTDTHLTCTLPKEAMEDNHETIFIDHGELSRLNDVLYMTAYSDAIDNAIKYHLDHTITEEMDEEADECANCIVLDLAGGATMFGVMASLIGADFVQVAGYHDHYHYLLTRLAEHNGVADKVSLARPLCEDIPWDIVVCDIVSPQGTLQSDNFTTLQSLR